MTTLWIALGGAVGTVARYHVGEWLQRRAGGDFPWGTLAVNVVGSAVIAAIMLASLRGEPWSPTVRVALTTGVLGGFTTYSTFNYETLALVQRGAWSMAALYVGATLLGCFAAGLLAWHGVRALLAG